MRCTNCGADIMIGTSFCSKCGAQALTAANMNYQGTKEEQTQPVKKKNGTASLVCGIIGLIMSLPGISIFTLVLPGFIFDILGIVMGSSINGDGKARAGRVIGIIGLVIGGLSLAIYIIAAVYASVEYASMPWYEKTYYDWKYGL